jgi:hypothetical protein
VTDNVEDLDLPRRMSTVGIARSVRFPIDVGMHYRGASNLVAMPEHCGIGIIEEHHDYESNSQDIPRSVVPTVHLGCKDSILMAKNGVILRKMSYIRVICATFLR